MKPSRARTRPWQAGLLLGLALGLAVAVPLGLGAAASLEGPVYDLLLRSRQASADPRILLVGMDDDTFNALGGRAPTRPEIARAVKRLWDGGASLIALDLLFTSPRSEAEDEPLQETLATADTVLAANPAASARPLPRFARQAVGVGSVDLMTDRDGVLRRLPPPYLAPAEGGLAVTDLPFALACARQIWLPGGPQPVKLEGTTLWLGNHPYPAGRTGWLIPFCGGDGTLPRLSFKNLLTGDARLPDLKGKIVLVGSTRPSAHDYFSVPYPARGTAIRGFQTMTTHTMAGVEVHGQALSALLKGEAICPPSGKARAALFVVLAALGTVLTMFPLKPALSLSIWLAFGLAILGGALVAIRHGLAVPLLALSVCWLAYTGCSFSYHRYRDFQEKRAVQRLFTRYVSPNVAKELLANPDLVHLGGRRKELTILFSDIRGFTHLSERLPPEQVSALLNEYFTVMTQVLFRFDGTLDKFIGDAILAFFGDPLDQPDQAARAMACAAAMQEEAAALRSRFEGEGKPPLHIGIAVHTGPAVVGNNGSETNFLYTVIGDTVNLAARLQGLAVQDDVITTIATAARIPGFEGTYAVERLDPVMVKGKSEAIPILRVLGRART